jgi:hypothetical protein
MEVARVRATEAEDGFIFTYRWTSLADRRNLVITEKLKRMTKRKTFEMLGNLKCKSMLTILYSSSTMGI